MNQIRILAVDDEKDVESLLLQSFRRQVRDGEFKFEFAYDGAEALDRLEAGIEADLILLDINMPRMDGLTLLERMKEQGLETRVIIVSAYGDMSNLRLSMNRGAYDFVTKPVDMRDLETTIRKTAAEVFRLRELEAQRRRAERSRRSLARFFAPPLVDFLSQRAEPLGPVRRQDVVILFAALVGFTQFAEQSEPEAVIELLRRFHALTSGIIFAHGGTIEKYIGDAVCAAFGVPEPREDDAARALTCAIAIIDALGRWNQDRVTSGETGIAVGVGLNRGPAVLGDIGSEHSMAFAVIGDSVNLASRLQTATRDLQTSLLISDSVVAAVREAAPNDATKLLDELSQSSEIDVKGRSKATRVWFNLERFPLPIVKP